MSVGGRRGPNLSVRVVVGRWWVAKGWWWSGGGGARARGQVGSKDGVGVVGR